jgi:hypothetical protein
LVHVQERAAKAAAEPDPPANSRPGSARRRILTNVALTTLSLVLTFVALEVVFRAFFPQALYAVRFAPWGHEHIPNAEFWHGAHAWQEGGWLSGTEFVTHIKYNSKGFRDDREHPYAKPPDTLRIVMLGDSYGEGMEVQLHETAARVLERQLNDWLASDAGRTAAQRGTRRSAGAPSPTGTLAGEVEPEPIPADWATSGQTPARDYWYATRMIFKRLAQSVRAAGAELLVANVHIRGDEYAEREEFFQRLGVPLVDVSSDLSDPANRYGLHYRYDGHWNARGHARAATLIADQIIADGLLPVTPDTRQVVVINTSMSAYSTCRELMLFEAEGARYEPDLVLVIHTGAEDRNPVDGMMCVIDPEGRLSLQPAVYEWRQELVRSIKGTIKSQSHFLTFVLDRLNRIDAIRMWNFHFEQQPTFQNVPLDR